MTKPIAPQKSPHTLETETDLEGAQMEMRPLSRLRRITMLSLAKLREATTLEIVAASGLAREAIQPRLSELKAAGLVEATGARRLNPSGKSAATLRLSEAGSRVVAGIK